MAELLTDERSTEGHVEDWRPTHDANAYHSAPSNPAGYMPPTPPNRRTGDRLAPRRTPVPDTPAIPRRTKEADAGDFVA